VEIEIARERERGWAYLGVGEEGRERRGRKISMTSMVLLLI